MNLKKFLEAMASQLETHAGLQESDGEMQPSHEWAVELTSTAAALRDAASRVNSKILVEAGDLD